MTETLVLDPLLAADEADAVVALWHDFPSYGLYSNESPPAAFAPELAQRYAAAGNSLRTGGRFGRTEDEPSMRAARTNYFRETYAYGEELLAPKVDSLLLHHERFLAAA